MTEPIDNDTQTEDVTEDSLREQEQRVTLMRRQLREQDEARTADDPRELLKRKVRTKLERGDAPSKADAWAFGSIRIAEAAEQARSNPSYSAVDYRREAAPNVDARGPKRKR